MSYDCCDDGEWDCCDNNELFILSKSIINNSKSKLDSYMAVAYLYRADGDIDSVNSILEKLEKLAIDEKINIDHLKPSITSLYLANLYEKDDISQYKQKRSELDRDLKVLDREVKNTRLDINRGINLNDPVEIKRYNDYIRFREYEEFTRLKSNENDRGSKKP